MAAYCCSERCWRPPSASTAVRRRPTPPPAAPTSAAAKSRSRLRVLGQRGGFSRRKFGQHLGEAGFDDAARTFADFDIQIERRTDQAAAMVPQQQMRVDAGERAALACQIQPVITIRAGADING